MNDADRQFLTEWGGEKWNEGHMEIWNPSTMRHEMQPLPNRPFDTWEDFGWLWERVLDRLGVSFCYLVGYIHSEFGQYSWYCAHPQVRCKLICDFLREQEKGGEG